jgi:hypothetical protein
MEETFVRRTPVIIAALLFLLAVIALAAGLVEHGDWMKPTLAAIWAGIDANSLIGFGALVEQKIDQSLWLDVVLPFLTWPAWSVPAILGIVALACAALFRRRADAEPDAPGVNVKA